MLPKKAVVAFAGFKHHIGFYPTSSTVKALAKDLVKFGTADASMVPPEKPLPLSFIRKITAVRVRQSIEEDKKWRK